MACHVPSKVRPAGPGPYAGQDTLVLSNGGRFEVCNVELGTQTYGTDGAHLVCRPDGTPLPPFGYGYTCVTPCLAPGESRSFAVKPGHYEIQGEYLVPRGGGEPLHHMYAGPFDVHGTTKIIFGAQRFVRRSPAGLEVGIGPDQRRFDAPPPEETPCTPTGQVYTGTRCCGGWVGRDPNGVQRCTDH
jgi:hypothetical protein